MSRLEQMREHFLQKIYYEQQQQYFTQQPKQRLTAASSIQNLSSPSNKSACPMQGQARRPPNRLQSMSSVKINTINRNGGNSFPARSNITRVKSLCNVNILAQGGKANGKNYNNVHSKYSQHRQSVGPNVNKTNNQQSNDNQINQPKPQINGNNNSSSSSVDSNARVHRSSKSQNVSRTHSVQETKRAAANKTKVVPECKYCSRKFAAKERLDKHMEICEKTFKKQRPVFNSAKQRFLELQQQQQQQRQKQEATASATESDKKEETSAEPDFNDDATSTDKSQEQSKKSSNWKESRQQFLKALKEARQKKLEESKSEDNCDDTPVICYDHKMPEETNPCTDVNEPADQTLNCSYCKRKFSPNVITKHETICGKLFRKQNHDIY